MENSLEYLFKNDGRLSLLEEYKILSSIDFEYDEVLAKKMINTKLLNTAIENYRNLVHGTEEEKEINYDEFYIVLNDYDNYVTMLFLGMSKEPIEVRKNIIPSLDPEYYDAFIFSNPDMVDFVIEKSRKDMTDENLSLDKMALSAIYIGEEEKYNFLVENVSKLDYRINRIILSIKKETADKLISNYDFISKIENYNLAELLNKISFDKRKQYLLDPRYSKLITYDDLHTIFGGCSDTEKQEILLSTNIIENLDRIKSTRTLDIDDEELKQSDVFDYAGIDKEYDYKENDVVMFVAHNEEMDYATLVELVK